MTWTNAHWPRTNFLFQSYLMISNCLLIIIMRDQEEEMVVEQPIKTTNLLLSIISLKFTKMEALKGVSTLLRTIYLCKETSMVSLFGLKIPNYLMRIISLIPLYMCCATMVAFCILKVDNIFTLLSVGYCLFGMSLMHMIQLSLIANESFLSQSMNHLKSLICQRTVKFPFRRLFVIDFNKKTILFFFLRSSTGRHNCYYLWKKRDKHQESVETMLVIYMFSIGNSFCGFIFEASSECLFWLVTAWNLVPSIASCVSWTLNRKKSGNFH